MSVEGINRDKRLLPWEPKDALFGYALEDAKDGDSVMVKEATQLQKDYHRYFCRNALYS